MVLWDAAAETGADGVDAALAATVASLALRDEDWPSSLLTACVQRDALRGIAAGRVRDLLLSRLAMACAEAAFDAAGPYAVADASDETGNAGPPGGRFVATARRRYLAAQVDESDRLRQMDMLADVILGPEAMAK